MCFQPACYKDPNTPKYYHSRPKASQNVYPVKVNIVTQVFIRLDPFGSGLVLV